MTNCRTDLSLYVKDISRYPLLTAEQERDLAAKIEGGDMEAKQWLICCNTRLVMNIARALLRRGGVEADDLISSGNIGLERAARDFDPASHRARFATYATWWIRQFMLAMIRERYLVHVPTYAQEIVLNPDRKHSRRAIKDNLCLEDAAKIMQADCGQLLSDGKGRPVNPVDLLTAPDCVSPMETDEDERARGELVDRMLASLTEVQETVLRMRLWQGMTLAQCGKKLGVTREYVRQVQNRSIAQLKERFACVEQTT